MYSSSPERAGGEPSLLSGQAAVRSDDLYSVSGFDHVHQVVVQDDVHGARQLSSGGFLWHLLHCNGLVVLVDGQPKLRLQRVVLLVLSREEEEEKLRSSHVHLSQNAFNYLEHKNKHPGCCRYLGGVDGAGGKSIQ